MIMRKQLIYSNEAPEITDDVREDFFECRGRHGNDTELEEFVTEDIRDFLANMRHAKDKAGRDIGDCPVVVTGILDLWHGKRSIRPVVESTFEDAVYHCVEGADIVRIYKQASRILIESVRHDGTNTFTIQYLNSYGASRFATKDDLNYQNNLYHRTLGRYLF